MPSMLQCFKGFRAVPWMFLRICCWHLWWLVCVFVCLLWYGSHIVGLSYPWPSRSCRLALSWACFCFLRFVILVLPFLLSIPWSVADRPFHGSVSIFFVSCSLKPSVVSWRLALPREYFCFLWFVFFWAFRGQLQTGSFMGVFLFSSLPFSLKPSVVSCRLALSWESFRFLLPFLLSLPWIADCLFHGGVSVFFAFFSL